MTKKTRKNIIKGGKKLFSDIYYIFEITSNNLFNFTVKKLEKIISKILKKIKIINYGEGIL